MSQYDFGTITPSTKSGTALASDLNAWRTALHSNHKGASAPSYKITGMLWIDDSSSPWKLMAYDGTDQIIAGYIDPTNNIFTPGVFFKSGTSIAAAATVNLAAATGNYVHITGSGGPITSFGTLPAGPEFCLVFDAAPTVTHNGTSLIMPQALSVTMAAGDILIVRSEGSGNWRAVNVQKADGTLILRSAASPVVFQEGDVAWDSDDDFLMIGTGGSNFKEFHPNYWEHPVGGNMAFGATATKDLTGLAGYRMLRINYALDVSVDAAAVNMRVSTDNGSSFLSGATEYNNFTTTNNGATITAANTAGPGIYLDANIGVDLTSPGGVRGTIYLYEFNQAVPCRWHGEGFLRNGTAGGRLINFGGDCTTTTAKNAIRFLASSGNISGEILVEGIRG